MARISFLTDEHIASAVARGLRARGIDALTAGQAALRGSADAVVLAHAKQDGRVLITSDADFLRLHSLGASHAGVLYVPPEASIGLMIGGALLLAEVLDAAAMLNHVEFL